MDEATRPSRDVAPAEEVSPPASTPPARAPIVALHGDVKPVSLREYFLRMGIEIIGLQGVDADIDSLEVCGFVPAGEGGKPDVSRMRPL